LKTVEKLRYRLRRMIFMAKKQGLEGKRVLVTGGASGIGLSLAEEFARRGCIPVLVDINQEALAEAERRLLRVAPEVYALKVDVSDREEVVELARRLEGAGSLPDILVNSAGVTLVAHAACTTWEDWRRILGVNLWGTVNVIYAFLPYIMEKGGGHIVNIGSIDGLIPIPGQSAYCASKFAVTGLSEVLRYDLRPCGIGVTLVCPGYVDTPMARSHPVRDLPLRFPGWEKVERFLSLFSSPPERIARETVRAVERGRFLVIPGLPSRAFYLLRRLFPGSAGRLGMLVGRLYWWARRPLPSSVR
jgi:NAD(P)-dependent dehydrogenase (short-subunit alcohol dehydrogenase family)